MPTKKEDKNLEVIKFKNHQPAVLEFDFDTIKGELTQELEKYQNVVVTPETCDADKKLAQKLAAKAKEYNRIRIDKVKEISAPIKLFEDQMKELTGLCNKVAENIKSQVKVFEDERLAEIQRKLTGEIFTVRQKQGVQPEYHEGSIDHLVRLTALTPKGALTKATSQALLAIAQTELAVQNKTENRLLKLEVKSHEAGLNTPLVRLNVEPFLFADDDTYELKLAELIESELGRQEQAEAKKIEQEERKARAAKIAKERTEQREKATEPQNPVEWQLGRGIRQGQTPPEVNQEQCAPESMQSPTSMVKTTAPQDEQPTYQPNYDEYAQQMAQEQSSHQQEQTIAVKEGNEICNVIATFKISVPATVSDKRIINKIQLMMSQAGITSLDTIEVIRNA